VLPKSGDIFGELLLLDKDKGCTIRDTEEHPNICKSYKGGYEYSYTCNEDINIIARSV
jgi:hypothetical protein